MRWRLALFAAAVVAYFVPPSGPLVERVYSRGIFPWLQRQMTAVSNLAPIALFDVLLVLVVFSLVALTALDVGQRRVRGWSRVSGRFVLRIVTMAAALYITFLVTWGLNYRRVPLSSRTPYDATRVSPEQAKKLGALTVTRLNALHAAAHAETPAPTSDVDRRLARAFAEAQPLFAESRPITPARPKRSLIDIYFRRAGVAGMTDPYFLETLMESDLLPVERPMVVAHEWAHLSGLGDEGEASYGGFLACLRGTALHQYSAWLALYSDIAGGLPRADATRLAATLEAGPRADLQAIRDRLRRQLNPTVSAAGWRVYDQYLKANRVDEGTNSYAEVVRLILGTGAVDY